MGGGGKPGGSSDSSWRALGGAGSFELTSSLDGAGTRRGRGLSPRLGPPAPGKGGQQAGKGRLPARVLAALERAPSSSGLSFPLWVGLWCCWVLRLVRQKLEWKLVSLFGQGFHMPTTVLFPGNCLQGNIRCGCQLRIRTAPGRRAMGRPRTWVGKGRGHSGKDPWVPAAPQETSAVRKTLRLKVTAAAVQPPAGTGVTRTPQSHTCCLCLGPPGLCLCGSLCLDHPLCSPATCPRL